MTDRASFSPIGTGTRHAAVPLLLVLCAFIGTACGLLGPDERRPVTADLRILASSDLMQSTVTAHTHAGIVPDQNLVWCGTYQLTWNMVADSLIGAPPILSGGAETQASVDGLNARDFEAADLDTSSYVALAGFRSDGIVERIQAALLERFGPEAPAYQLPEDPAEFLSFACLKKNLPFTHPFESLEDPILFGGDAAHPVLAFGFEADSKGPEADALRAQVRGFSRGGTEGVELLSESTRDHLYLALTDPDSTLDATWRKVADVIADEIGTRSPAGLRIPKINFELQHHFEELMGTNGLFGNPGWERWSISDAYQSIRFQLSERGAVLESQAYTGVEPRSVPWILTFDRPFLLVMIEEGADYPYFMMWVGNFELLAPA